MRDFDRHTGRRRSSKQHSTGQMLASQRDTALKYVETIKSDNRIIAVVGLGSIARKYADEISDIDLGIIFTGNGLPIPQGETLFNGHCIDNLLVHISFYQKVEEWPLWMRETFSSGVLLYSRDGKITESNLRKHAAPKKEELRRLANEILMDLAWHGITLKNKISYDTPYQLPESDFLVKRTGELGAGVYHGFALQQILRLFFIANRSFPPTPKWLLFQLPGRDSHIDKKVRIILKNGGIKQQEKALRDLLHTAVVRLEKARVIPSSLFDFHIASEQRMKWGMPQHV